MKKASKVFDDKEVAQVGEPKTEKYFPILIAKRKTNGRQALELIVTPKDLPAGQDFMVVETNIQNAKEIEKFIELLNKHFEFTRQNPQNQRPRYV